ncbi:hypothetical protein B7R87_03320 [Streptomyces tsukubensis]|nr:hypothetical protein B7R87_03320 [Streptomyces tsukubensis]
MSRALRAGLVRGHEAAVPRFRSVRSASDEYAAPRPTRPPNPYRPTRPRTLPRQPPPQRLRAALRDHAPPPRSRPPRSPRRTPAAPRADCRTSPARRRP